MPRKKSPNTINDVNTIKSKSNHPYKISTPDQKKKKELSIKNKKKILKEAKKKHKNQTNNLEINKIKNVFKKHRFLSFRTIPRIHKLNSVVVSSSRSSSFRN